MTTNQDRAAQKIREGLAHAWASGPIFDTREFPAAAAQAIADAQPPILMADPPAPVVGEESGIADWYITSWSLSVYPEPNPDAGMVIVENRTSMKRPHILHPINARELGHALIAAADYAEQEKS